MNADGPQSSYERLAARIRRELPGMSPQLAQGARFLLDHPDDVALLSMRQLAGQAGVTPTTLVRLARHLGAADWEGLRRGFADRLRSLPLRYGQRAEALAHAGAGAGLVAAAGAAQQANLAYVAAANPPPALLAAATILERAPRLFVAGFRSCRAPAEAFAYLCRMFHPDVRVLGSEAGALEAHLAGLTRPDAVLAITFRHYSREIGLVLDAVRRRGPVLVSLVDSLGAPTVPASAATLQFTVDSPSFFPSVVGATALAETLAMVMLAQGGRGRARLVRRAEAELAALGAYLGEHPASG
jgi:DNA-binding MurR/RpiR family transcriptional regulator